MARFNTSLALQYVTDFGQTIATPINFKIHQAAPIPNGFYVPRLGNNPCPVGSRLSTRALLATFVLNEAGDTGQFRYPVPLKVGGSGIFALAQALTGLGAICIDLVGERWIRVPNSQLGGIVPSYRTTPYTNIPGEPNKTVVSYQYDSDVSAQLGGQQNFSTNYETLPVELASVSSNCLTNPQERNGSGVCGTGDSGIEPRKLLWQAEASDSPDGSTIDGIISRQSIVSAATDAELRQCLVDIADSVYCAGYEGESIRNLQSLIAL